MAKFFMSDEEKTTIVLANACVAFAVLAAFSPETSRPYLMAAATALGLFSLYPLYLILQRPRRFMVARETEGDKSVYILRYKGYLWWYDATDRTGNDIVFNSLEEAQAFVKENMVTAMISDKMRRRSMKREFEVILDSKEMVPNTRPTPAGNNKGDQHKDASPTPQPDAAKPKEDEREEIVPDNIAAIASMLAKGKADQDENDEDEVDEEDGKEMTRRENADARENKGVAFQRLQDAMPPGKDAPEDGSDPEDGNGDAQGDPDDPFDGNYPVPVVDMVDGDRAMVDSPDEDRGDGSDSLFEMFDAESFNEQLFDVIDYYNKSANQKKPSPKPNPATPAPPVGEKQRVTMVTTAQVVEEQALVHAHQAETVKDALGKILFHQQLVEMKEERKAAENKATTVHGDGRPQAIPKSKRNKAKPKDGIPTKSIKYRPSSEEKVLRRQMSLLEIPGFVNPEEISKTDHAAPPQKSHAVAEGALHQGVPEGDAAGNDGSSGGPGMAGGLQGAVPESPGPESGDAALASGSESAGGPQVDDNETLAL